MHVTPDMMLKAEMSRVSVRMTKHGVALLWNVHVSLIIIIVQ